MPYDCEWIATKKQNKSKASHVLALGHEWKKNLKSFTSAEQYASKAETGTLLSQWNAISYLTWFNEWFLKLETFFLMLACESILNLNNSV